MEKIIIKVFLKKLMIDLEDWLNKQIKYFFV
jgi:hypothetical protein